MKHWIQLPNQARQAVCNSELPVTHCLVGRRDDLPQRPDDELLKKINDVKLVKGTSPEERAEVARYRWDKAHGHYGLRALGWCASEVDAETLKGSFPAPEWDQAAFQIVPVQSVKYG